MLHPLVEVAESEVIHGKGLVAAGLIRKGEVVSRLEPNQPTYRIEDILKMSDEEQQYVLHFAYQCDDETFVAEQGPERFMNHSCDPNTYWLDDETMIARRDIQPGEELTYDYATTDITIPFEMACSCDSPNCRRKVTHLDHLKPEWQAQYGEYLPQHVLRAIEKSRQQINED
jgi:uncharacterized protein